MSGFVAVFQRDGSPADVLQLRRLTDSLSHVGPDGSDCWSDGPVGLGHARFVTHAARDGAVQPIRLEPGLTLAGDIRLDARDELVAALGPGPQLAACSDAELVLHAYRRWGEACVEHIAGDFSFTLWDGPARKLFCARDAFGVKPLLYVLRPGLFVCANAFHPLLSHPAVSRARDDYWTADFIVFGLPLESFRSAFADLRRLPPGHSLVVTGDVQRVSRYFTLPIEPTRRFREPAACIEEYGALVRQAIVDRQGSGPVALFMSGGLDSGVLGAQLVSSAPGQARGFCSSWGRVFEDPEPGYAREASQALGLPLEVMERVDPSPFADMPPAAIAHEPGLWYYAAHEERELSEVGSFARIVLSGDGGDELLMPETVLGEFGRTGDWHLFADAARTWVRQGRPPIGLRGGRRAPATPVFTIPRWLDPAWCEGLKLDDRVRWGNELMFALPGAPRAAARLRLGFSALWQPAFDHHSLRPYPVRVDVRRPLLDLRVVRFALSLTPFPWCMNKELQRAALRSRLPARLFDRPKTLLCGDPLTSALLQVSSWGETGGRQQFPEMIDAQAWRDDRDANRAHPRLHAVHRLMRACCLKS